VMTSASQSILRKSGGTRTGAGGGILAAGTDCFAFCVLRLSLLICDKLRLRKTAYLKDNRHVCPLKSMRFMMFESLWRTLLQPDVQCWTDCFFAVA
jgi:hypothetical protein